MTLCHAWTLSARPSHIHIASMAQKFRSKIVRRLASRRTVFASKLLPLSQPLHDACKTDCGRSNSHSHSHSRSHSHCRSCSRSQSRSRSSRSPCFRSIYESDYTSCAHLRPCFRSIYESDYTSCAHFRPCFRRIPQCPFFGMLCVLGLHLLRAFPPVFS